MTYLKFEKTKLVNLEYSLNREVIRTNRAGGFACTTIVDCNIRKYHGLLVCPLPKLDGGKHVLLSSIDETIIQHDQEFNLGMHKYAGDHYDPKGHKYIRDFSSDPIPKILYRVGGVLLSKERVLVENENRMLTRYTLIEAHSPTTLRLKPFLAFRNIHSLSKANLNINSKYKPAENGIASKLYNGYPELFMQISKNNEFVSAPDWYYNIEYLKEQERGYDYKEDLFVPGYFEMPIKKGESIIFSAGLSEIECKNLKAKFTRELKKRIPRNNFNNCLSNATSQFFSNSEKKTEIESGYPWLPKRTRDALIALPGLTLTDQNINLYKKTLSTVLSYKKGHLFNEFMDSNAPENYPIDIPLWFIWCIQQLKEFGNDQKICDTYSKYVRSILNGFMREKNRFKVESNCLIYASQSQFPNTWMNGQINGRSAVNRYGFLVEVNALWYNAICFAIDCAKAHNDDSFSKKWSKIKTNIEQHFSEVFWQDSGYLADFVANNIANNQMRPNQVFATSLKYSPLTKDQRKSILDRIKQELVTTKGLRTLSPSDKAYLAKYEGNHEQRENAAFNGSVWPWLFTHYFEGLMHLYPKSAVRAAKKFTNEIKNEIQIGGLCSISELYNGDPPHKANGALSFAMNTGEMLRLKWILDKKK